MNTPCYLLHDAHETISSNLITDSDIWNCSKQLEEYWIMGSWGYWLWLFNLFRLWTVASGTAQSVHTVPCRSRRNCSCVRVKKFLFDEADLENFAYLVWRTGFPYQLWFLSVLCMNKIRHLLIHIVTRQEIIKTKWHSKWQANQSSDLCQGMPNAYTVTKNSKKRAFQAYFHMSGRASQLHQAPGSSQPCELSNHTHWGKFFIGCNFIICRIQHKIL